MLSEPLPSGPQSLQPASLVPPTALLFCLQQPFPAQVPRPRARRARPSTKFNATSTLATWLQPAGYRTGYFGKYLNDYSKLAPRAPPGWNEWQVFFSDQAYYNYKMSSNGVTKGFYSQPSHYSTTVIWNTAVQFIKSTPSSQTAVLAVCGSGSA